MNERAKFVVLSQPRTGSTLFCSLLNSNKNVRVLIEPINPKTHSHHMQPLLGNLMPEEMVQNDITKTLDILFDEEPPTWIQTTRFATLAAGFKIMAHQVAALRQENIFWYYLKEHAVKAVIIFRHNILLQHISDLIVRVTNQPVCWDGNIVTARVEVPIQTLADDLKAIVSQRNYLLNKAKQYSLDYTKLAYESYQHNTAAVAELLPWLVGETYVLKSKLMKQNPNSVFDRVVNYDAIADELRRIGMLYLLDSDYGS